MTLPAVLITGATGFIGRNLARRLREADVPVFAIVRESSDIAVLTSLGVRCHVYAGDVEMLTSQIGNIRPATVFHLASRFVAEHCPEDIAPLIGTNLLFATHLLEAMARNGVDRLVNTGTCWENWSNADPAPSCLYAATKAAFEQVLSFYRSAHGTRSVTLRLYDTFGPDDDRPKLLSLLKRIAVSGETFAMSGGEQTICPLFISDVTDGFLSASDILATYAPGEGSVYSLPGPSLLTLRDFVALFEQVHGSTVPIEWGGRPYRAREVMAPWQGTVLPGWQAKISLEQGLTACLGDHAGV